MADAETTEAEVNDNGAFPFQTFTLADVAGVTDAIVAAIDNDDLAIKSDIDDGTGRVNRYTVYRNWYRGVHAAVLTERQQGLFEASGIAFSDNFLDMIVDSPTRRLQLTGVSFTPENTKATDIVEEFMRANRMDILGKRVHHNAIKLGDAFAILDFDPLRQTPTITYNRPDIIRPEYDDDTGEEMLWASKVWETTEVSPFNELGEPMRRMNVYYSDRIEKYYAAADGDDWLPFMDLKGDTPDILWPVPWIDTDTGEPLGIPVFHFRNKTLDESFGISELNKAIPQQALLNKSILDLDRIMDTQGYPQRWASGVDDTGNDEADVDSATSQTDFDSEPGSVWHTDNENAKFGQFASAPLDGALSAIEMIVNHMSASNSTPIHDLLNGSRNAASGEALKMKDSGLSEKVEDMRVLAGNVWEDIIRYAFKLRHTFGTNLEAVDLIGSVVESQWKDTTPRNEKVATAVMSQMVNDLGASQRWALSNLGVDNVDEVMAEREAELDAGSERMLRSVTRGIDPTDDAEIDTEVEDVENG